MGRFNYERAQRQERLGQFASAGRYQQPRRRRSAHPHQHETIVSLCKELKRDVMDLPETAYDARMEIYRLRRLVETRRRMEGEEQS